MSQEKKPPPPSEVSLNYTAWSVKTIATEMEKLNKNLETIIELMKQPSRLF